MPRTADRDARRRQIADAACSIVAGHGLDAASVARVAAQAGVSVGLVQHYFPSKDAMLLFAYQQVMTDLDARVAARIVEGEAQQQTISAMVFSSLCELLPVDDLRHGEYRVTRAFHGRALDNDALAEVARTTSADIRARLAVAVTNGKECGEVEGGVDAELVATRMTALVSGLAEQLHLDRRRSVGPMDLSAAAKVLLRSCLDDVFTGECRRHG